MSAALTSDSDGGRRTIAVAALLATYMEAVNISLPNAALPHIQGTLSMANDEVGWVFTAYIAAGAVVMPMARWLAGHFGRKAVYLVSLAVFSLGLVLDTLATTTLQFVLARIVQGVASGTLAPLSLAILLDLLPPERHARINLVWSVCLVLGISSGASIGGWLSEYHGWRSIFYLGLPMTGFIFLTMALSLPEKKAEQNQPFDFFGLATFSLGMIGLQMLLDRVMSGGVSVNEALFHVAQHDLPFGGVGESGMGHYHGREGFDTFSKLRPVFYQARFSALKLIGPPYGKFATAMLGFLTK